MENTSDFKSDSQIPLYKDKYRTENVKKKRDKILRNKRYIGNSDGIMANVKYEQQEYSSPQYFVNELEELIKDCKPGWKSSAINQLMKELKVSNVAKLSRLATGALSNYIKLLKSTQKQITKTKLDEAGLEMYSNYVDTYSKELADVNFSKYQDLIKELSTIQVSVNKKIDFWPTSIIIGLNKKIINALLQKVEVKTVGKTPKQKNTQSNCLEVHFIDVGQGDSTFIVLPDDNQTTILVDCGSKQNSDIGIRNVKACINQVNPKEKSIDYLVLTHGDSDHYNMVNNLYADEYTFENIYVGGKLEDYDGINHLNPKPQVLVDFLNTLDGKNNKNLLGSNNDFVCVLSANMATTTGLKSPSRKNQDSICLRIAWKTGNSTNYVYLMGDAEAPVEKDIIHKIFGGEDKVQETDGGLSVIKLGHHGSKAGTSEEWVKSTVPNLITVSAGSKWEHPYHEAVGRGLGLSDQDMRDWTELPSDHNKYPQRLYENNITHPKHEWIANNFLDKKASIETYTNYNNNLPVYTNIQKVEYNKDKTFTATGSSYALYIYENGKCEINPYGEGDNNQGQPNMNQNQKMDDEDKDKG